MPKQRFHQASNKLIKTKTQEKTTEENEMMKEQNHKKLMSETLKYLGKTLKKQGETNGKPWKIWKLSFDIGGQYPWQTSAFDNISEKGVQVKDMNEGEYYEIVYKINEFKSDNYGIIKSKQAVLIKESSEDKATNGQNQTKPDSQSNPILEVKGWDEFTRKYDENFKKEEQSRLHMLAVYLINEHKKSVQDIASKCEEHFQNK